MDFDTYSKEAFALAIYPERGEFAKTKKITKGLQYVCLKLIGESGEFSEKIGKCIRDSNSIISVDLKAALLYELGDILWYCNALCQEFSSSLSHRMQMAGPEIIRLSRFFKIDPVDTVDFEFATLSGHLAAEACGILELILNLVIFAHKSEKHLETANIYYRISNLLALIVITSRKLGSTEVSVARMNLDKLKDRQARGKLQGSGDNR